MGITSGKNVKRNFFIRMTLFLVLISVAGMTQTQNLMAENYVPVFVFGGRNIASDGQFSSPIGIAIDGDGNIFVADTNNDRIQKFDSAGKFLMKFGSSGIGNGQFNFPEAVAIDGDGNIFVADSNSRIQKFDSVGNFLMKFESYGYDLSGVAVDNNGNIFVGDSTRNCIQKFDSIGNFLMKFGSYGYDDGKFHYLSGVAVDNNGDIFVGDSTRNCIQKFDSIGNFLMKFGSTGTGNGQFLRLDRIAIDSTGNIFVTDIDISRVQKFSSTGVYQSQFGSIGAGNGQFLRLGGIAVNSIGNIFVVDTFNHRIQKFNSAGFYQNQFGSSVISGNGKFYSPRSIATDSSGNIFVADTGACIVQKFSRDGVYMSQFGSCGSDNGQFDELQGIAIDSSGNIFVADTFNHRIQKFSSEGVYLSQFGTEGSGDGQFKYPNGIGIDSFGNIFVADNRRIQKFDSTGNYYLMKFGSYGSDNGQFLDPSGVAIDSFGNIFVTDNNRIKKFDSAGNYLMEFGTEGSGDGQFKWPKGIAIDSSGNIFVADSGNCRVQKFSRVGLYLSQFGTRGSGNGQFDYPNGIAIDSSGNIFVTDSGNYRIQKWTVDKPKSKAIIVAGGGNYLSNALWEATKRNTDFAYESLIFQGYKPENIYYLSEDNGFSTLINGTASKKNLEYAITSWAKDADNLLIYMADHGGDGTFRMSETEILHASELAGWLDSIQQTIPGNVILVYDACRSGSFIRHLKGQRRILLTSASDGENAVFASDGTLSFSWLFWSQIYSGRRFYDAFVNTKNSMNLVGNSQHSLIDADGDGVANSKTDTEIASGIGIGDQKSSADDFPTIGSVSPAQTLTNTISAKIYADNVLDADDIKKVWAVITPPNYVSYSADTPVISLPTVELKSVGNNRYEATYDRFIAKRTYKIVIFATDNRDFTSLPEEKHITSVTQTRGNSCVFVNNDLDLNICAEYQGVKYGFTMKFADAAQLSWNMDAGTFIELQSDPGNCISVGNDLKLDMCAEYQGKNYGFTMNYDKDLIWKMDISTFKEIH